MEEKNVTPVQGSNPNQAPPVQPMESTSNIKQKSKLPLLIAAIILVLLVAGGVSAFVLTSQQKSKTSLQNQTAETHPTPTPDPTANWKTYTDMEFGFSFKYPEKEYLFDKHKEPDPTSIVEAITHLDISYCPTKKLTDCGYQSKIFQIRIYKNPQGKYLTSFFSKSFREACFWKDPRTKEQSENFMGYDAQVYTYTIDELTAKQFCKDIPLPLEYGGDVKRIFFEKDGDIYEIAFVAATSKDRLEELKHILSTFKFTK